MKPSMLQAIVLTCVAPALAACGSVKKTTSLVPIGPPTETEETRLESTTPAATIVRRGSHHIVHAWNTSCRRTFTTSVQQQQQIEERSTDPSAGALALYGLAAAGAGALLLIIPCKDNDDDCRKGRVLGVLAGGGSFVGLEIAALTQAIRSIDRKRPVAPSVQTSAHPKAECRDIPVQQHDVYLRVPEGERRLGRLDANSEFVLPPSVVTQLASSGSVYTLRVGDSLTVQLDLTVEHNTYCASELGQNDGAASVETLEAIHKQCVASSSADALREKARDAAEALEIKRFRTMLTDFLKPLVVDSKKKRVTYGNFTSDMRMRSFNNTYPDAEKISSVNALVEKQFSARVAARQPKAGQCISCLLDPSAIKHVEFLDDVLSEAVVIGVGGKAPTERRLLDRWYTAFCDTVGPALAANFGHVAPYVAPDRTVEWWYEASFAENDDVPALMVTWSARTEPFRLELTLHGDAHRDYTKLVKRALASEDAAEERARRLAESQRKFRELQEAAKALADERKRELESKLAAASRSAPTTNNSSSTKTYRWTCKVKCFYGGILSNAQRIYTTASVTTADSPHQHIFPRSVCPASSGGVSLSWTGSSVEECKASPP